MYPAEAYRASVTCVRPASDAAAGYKDSRAPQNLYPIAGLERALRRRLGDAGVLYRALRSAAGRPVDSAAGRPVDLPNRAAPTATVPPREAALSGFAAPAVRAG